MVQAVGSVRFGKVTIGESIENYYGENAYKALQGKFHTPGTFKQMFDIFENKSAIEVDIDLKKGKGDFIPNRVTLPTVVITARNSRDTDKENPKGKILHSDYVLSPDSLDEPYQIEKVIAKAIEVAVIADHKLFKKCTDYGLSWKAYLTIFRS